MPGMGGGGMGGAGMQGLMAALMSDPELAKGMQNPKVMAALQAMQSNPAAAAQHMKDPEVAAFVAKLQAKMGGMGGGGGMPAGGMGGMGGMARRHAAAEHTL